MVNFSSSDLTCCECGIVFGVPSNWLSARRQDKRSFHCPNGHAQSFTESEADRLRRERDRLQQQIAQKDDEIRYQKERRQSVEKQVSVAKGQITRLKKRANAGVCPCCNRTFSNMAQHMKHMHPDHDPNVIDLGAEKAKRA